MSVLEIILLTIVGLLVLYYILQVLYIPSRIGEINDTLKDISKQLQELQVQINSTKNDNNNVNK